MRFLSMILISLLILSTNSPAQGAKKEEVQERNPFEKLSAEERAALAPTKSNKDKVISRSVMNEEEKNRLLQEEIAKLKEENRRLAAIKAKEAEEKASKAPQKLTEAQKLQKQYEQDYAAYSGIFAEPGGKRDGKQASAKKPKKKTEFQLIN